MYTPHIHCKRPEVAGKKKDCERCAAVVELVMLRKLNS
jgi:hypothetical protein